MKNLSLKFYKSKVRPLCTLAVLIMSIAMAGCFPKRERGLVLGPEVTAAEVNKAINEGIEPLNPYTLQVGDFSHVVHSVRVETPGGPQETVTKEEGRNVLKREETATELLFTLVNEVVEYRGDESTKALFESTVKLPKISKLPTLEDAIDMPEAKAHEASLKLTSELGPKAVVHAMAEERVTYHNLTVSNYETAPPASVKARANCSGVPGCRIRIRQVEFDQVVYPSSGDFKRARF